MTVNSYLKAATLVTGLIAGTPAHAQNDNQTESLTELQKLDVPTFFARSYDHFPCDKAGQRVIIGTDYFFSLTDFIHESQATPLETIIDNTETNFALFTKNLGEVWDDTMRQADVNEISARPDLINRITLESSKLTKDFGAAIGIKMWVKQSIAGILHEDSYEVLGLSPCSIEGQN